MPVGNASLITRCPDCLTAFRATAEQLALRDGRVRCGHCGTVFDARVHAIASSPPPEVLTATSPGGVEAVPGDAEEPAAGQHPDLQSGAGGQHTPDAPEVPGPSGVWPQAVEPTADAPAPWYAPPEHADDIAASAQESVGPDVYPVVGPTVDTAFAPNDTPDAPITPGDMPASEALVLEPAPAGDAFAAVPAQAFDERRGAGSTGENTATNNLEFDFGRRRPARTWLPWLPWLAWPLAVLLLAALTAQAAFNFRGDLALLFPAAKPYAEELCARLGCSIPLPRRAELMSIESSDLQADSSNPGVMVLSATLRNRAPFAQMPPALELTLTDTQDQPVARRVLMAADYVAAGTAGSAAGNTPNSLFPAGVEIPVKVFFDASAVKATGYRLYLFYP